MRQSVAEDVPDESALTDGMAWIPGGTFSMGSDTHYPEEAPARHVAVDGFWIDRTPVTNRAFARFVAETGYVTVAERIPDRRDYPDADLDLLVAGSLVFVRPDDHDGPYWWRFVPGADWRHPQGPDSDLTGQAEHPVVHVCHADAVAYAGWRGVALPTEAEWEFCARGGTSGTEFAWGHTLAPGGVHRANTWQGRFPHENTAADGFAGTSPVTAFPPNGYGVFDMIGNVWEWTDDWYDRHPEKTCCLPRNPRGGNEDDSRDASGFPRKVLKGGSHLCAPNWCRRYRPPARQPQTIDTASVHIGFRCVHRRASPQGLRP